MEFREERGLNRADTEDRAVSLLCRRGLLAHVDMIEAVRRKNAQILYACEDGVMIYETDSRTCMIAADNLEPCRNILKKNTYHQFAVHNRELAEEIQKEYHFSTSVATSQAAWMKEEPPAFDDSGIIRLKPEHAKEVCSHYTTMEDPGEYVEELISRGQMWGMFQNGNLAGFVGEHLEGSMGLLEVVPEYRRQGIGFRLEAYLIRHFVEQGRIPFCQIIEGNDESMNLQKKLGMEVAALPTWWLFD